MSWRWCGPSATTPPSPTPCRHAGWSSAGGRRSSPPSILSNTRRWSVSVEALVTQLKHGLDAPICLTWELTYACNLQCVHCLSSSGRRDPRELTTAEAKRVLDELRDLKVFYINIGGGEPMVRRDFFELLEYSIAAGIGVKFSTNGAFIDPDKARRLAAMDYLDIQISLDGTDAATNDAVRGAGSYATARQAMQHLADADFGPFKISVVVTLHNVDQLDGFKAL